MQKAAPTLGRVLVMVAFALSCFGLLLFLWLAFGGPIPLQPKGYEFHIKFPEATQLAKQADVRISGVPVGKVSNLQPDARDGLTDATITLDAKYAPIPRDARAILRQKTLLGETYVELTPGQRGNKRMGLPDGGTLAQSQVAPSVQLDEIFRAFDPKTRRSFQQFMATQASALNGRGPDINNALGNLAPFAEDTSSLLGTLDSQHQAVHRLISNTGVVFNALSARDHQLSSLIRNSNTVFGVTATQDRALQDVFRVLPTFQQESKLTFARLDRFANNANPLVNQLHPVARQLSPTFVQLQRLAPDLNGLFNDLGPLIQTSKRGLPALRTTLDQLRPVLAQLDPALQQLNPAIRYIYTYKRELNTFFANSTAATEASDRPFGPKGPAVHYLRTLNPINVENFAVYTKRTATTRTLPYALPGAYARTGHPNLQSFECRQVSNRGAPALVAPRSTIPAVQRLKQKVSIDVIFNAINLFAFSTGAAGALGPPCNQQPPIGPATGFGRSDFPHVTPSRK